MDILRSLRLLHGIIRDKRLLPKVLRDKINSSIIPAVLNVKDEEWIRLNSWRYGEIPRCKITDIFPGIEDVDIVMLKCFMRRIGLSIDPLEILYIISIAKFINAKKVCEIGTYDGNTILNLAANTPEDAILTTIDLPPDWKNGFALDVLSLERWSQIEIASAVNIEIRSMR